MAVKAQQPAKMNAILKWTLTNCTKTKTKHRTITHNEKCIKQTMHIEERVV